MAAWNTRNTSTHWPVFQTKRRNPDVYRPWDTRNTRNTAIWAKSASAALSRPLRPSASEFHNALAHRDGCEERRPALHKLLVAANPGSGKEKGRQTYVCRPHARVGYR